MTFICRPGGCPGIEASWQARQEINQGRVVKVSVYLFAVIMCQALAGGVAAGEHHSHESIRAVVEQFVIDESGNTHGVEPSVNKLDARLRLHQCTNPLNTFWPPGSRKMGSTSVGVACEDEKPWKIYVPVKISVFAEIAVVSRPLLRGDTLKEGDIELERRDISRLGQRFINDYSGFLGYQLRQAVSAGTVLQARMLRVPELVKRGEKVILLASGGGIEIRMMGEALSDGGKGAVIRVRNIKSKRIVEGEVVSKGVVKVRL